MAANVRIQSQSYNKLRAMAKASNVKMPDVLAKAIDERYQKWLLEGLADDYARLRADPKAWAEELKERELWDCTLADGLKDL